MRLVVAPDRAGRAARARTRCWSRHRRSRRRARRSASPPVSSTSPGAERLRVARGARQRCTGAARGPVVARADRSPPLRARTAGAAPARRLADRRSSRSTASSVEALAPLVLPGRCWAGRCGSARHRRVARRPAAADRGSGAGQQHAERPARCRPAPRRAARFARQPQRAAEQHDQQRQAVGADQPRRRRATAYRPASRRPGSRRSR